MDTTLRQEAYEHYACVFTGEISREFGEETVVPDTMPDVGAVLDTQGTLCIRGKQVEAGCVTVSASVGVCVLYEPTDGGALRCVETELPAELRLDAPGADDGCRVCADARLLSVEARAVNSRKLAIRAEVAVSVKCYRSERTAVTACPENSDGAHILTKTAEILTVADAREKTFVVTDEYAVPAGLAQGARVISRRASGSVDDVKYVSGKVIFRGRTVSELVFADEDGAARAARFETEFSQIMEIDCTSEDALPTVALLLTGAYFDMPEFGEASGRVSAELHFAAQCVCRERRRLMYLSDVYANRTTLIPSFSELSVVTDARPVAMRQTVAGRAEPAAEGETFLVSASVGAASVRDGAVVSSVVVRLVTRAVDGSMTASRCRLPVEFTLTEPGPGASLTDVTVTATDVYAAGQDVRAVLEMNGVLTSSGTIRFVSEIAEDAQAALPKHASATLVRVEPGAELWQLARRLGSSVEAIAAANAGKQDGLLLIPKSR